MKEKYLKNWENFLNEEEQVNEVTPEVDQAMEQTLEKIVDIISHFGGDSVAQQSLPHIKKTLAQPFADTYYMREGEQEEE